MHNFFFCFKQLVEDPPNGLVSFTVDGTDKSLPFGLEDVFSQATMLIGDMVQFNIATNCETKKERAVNIKIQPETFETQLMEKRKSVSFDVVFYIKNRNSNVKVYEIHCYTVATSGVYTICLKLQPVHLMGLVIQRKE